MNEQLNKVLEYERRLIQDRQSLLELLAEADGSQDELVRYKLECFQKEIAFMNRQVELLKQEARETQQMPSSETVQMTQVQEAAPVFSGKQEPVRQDVPVLPPKAATVPAASTAPVKKKDLEQTVGKSLMGIFASVLIFISLILFATLLLPYFNDTAKMVTTYVVSFVFLGIGLLKLKKDRENKFYLALTGCGIGALYISLLLSNMYFKVLGDIPLYVLICVWGVGVSLFAKNQSLIFRIIGELGITISVIFGSILCMNNEDPVKMLAVMIFYVVSSAVFYIVHYEKEFVDNLVHHISNVINVYMLTGSMLFIVGKGAGHFEAWLVLALVLVSIGSTLWHRLETDVSGVLYGFFAAGYSVMLGVVLDSMFDTSEYIGIIIYAAMAILLAVYEWKKACQPLGKYIVQVVLLALCMAALDGDSDLYCYGMVPLLILPAMLVGYWRENVVLKYGSLVILFIYSFDYHAYTQVPHYLMGCVAMIAGFVLVWWRKEQYSRSFKNALHIVSVLFLMICTGDVIKELGAGYLERGSDYPEVMSYILVTLFNIGMLKSLFAKNQATGETEPGTMYNIINMLLMIGGVFKIACVNSEQLHLFWHIMLIVTVLGAFMVNSKNLLEKRESLWMGIYVGVKFTLLLIVILSSFDTVNYVVSIACLLLAIGSIVLGFVGEYKSLRIFGLVLSMISTFKLIMIDISYENTLGNALSFFVSGILCFVISLIYNYIDNKLKERA